MKKIKMSKETKKEIKAQLILIPLMIAGIVLIFSFFLI